MFRRNSQVTHYHAPFTLGSMSSVGAQSALTKEGSKATAEAAHAEIDVLRMRTLANIAKARSPLPESAELRARSRERPVAFRTKRLCSGQAT